MPVSYAFDERIVVVRAEGDYSEVDLEDTILAALTDPRRPHDVALLMDVSGSSTFRDRPTDDFRGTARFLARHRLRYGSRVAIVAPSDLAFGLMRMAAVTAEAGGVMTEVFREWAPARAWLRGEGPPALERVETAMPAAAAAAAPPSR